MKKCGFFAALLLCLLSFHAFGAESNGVLFSLKPDAVMTLSVGEDEAFQKVYEGAGIYLAEDEESLAPLRESGLIAYEEPNYTVTLLGDAPRDTYYSRQWMHPMIGTESLWDKGLYGEGVRIAVVDTGVTAHEDLEGAILPGHYYFSKYSVTPNLLPTLDPSDTSDTNGHGTFISGLIAARMNGIGTVGVAPKAQIVPLRVFSKEKTTSLDVILKALEEAVTVYHCQVVNMSFGLTEDSEFFREAIEKLDAQGAILVAAVGNDGTKDLMYPAAYPEVIGVGALNERQEVSSFSQNNQSVWVTMPGEELLGLGYTGGYAIGDGTSFSAPLVSAFAAAALEINPTLDSKGFKAALSLSTLDLGAEGYDTSYGHGLVKADALLKTLLSGEKAMVSPYYESANGEKEILIMNNSKESLDAVSLWGAFSEERLTALDPFGIKLAPGSAAVRKVPATSDTLKHFLWTDLINIQPIR